MWGMRQTLRGKAIVASSVLALILGGFAMTGCGSSPSEGGTDESAPAEVATQEEASLEEADDDVNHWFTQRKAERSTYDGQNWDGEGTTTNHSKTVERFKRDEHGNVTRVVRTSTNSTDDQSSPYESKTVTRYRRDENGWPLRKKTTETSTSTYVDNEGNPQTEELESEVATVTYDYEYDDEGRVIKATSSDEREGSLELTYNNEGKVASVKRTYSTYFYTDGEEQEATICTEESTFDEKGNATASTLTTVEPDGKKSVQEHEFDSDGTISKMTLRLTPSEGDESVLVWTYDNERDAKGNVIKSTATVTGDGVGENDRWTSNGQHCIKEVFMEDGTISASEVTQDEQSEDVAGETKTYDGPYSGSEYGCDENGNPVSMLTTYYDGTSIKGEFELDANGNTKSYKQTNEDGSTNVFTYEYDDEGNRTKYTQSYGKGDTTNTYDTSYKYVYIEEPSDYLTNCKPYFWGWDVDD